MLGAYYDGERQECVVADPRMSVGGVGRVWVEDAVEFRARQGEFLRKHPDFSPYLCKK